MVINIPLGAGQCYAWRRRCGYGYGLVAVAVAAAVFEAFVVASFVAVQVLLSGLATELGLGVVTVLIGAAVVCTIVETVFIAVIVAHFPVLADMGRFLLLRWSLW